MDSGFSRKSQSTGFSTRVASGFSRKSLALLLLLALAAIDLSAQSAGNYLIGPKDVLSIQVFDQPDLGGKYTVEADGSFSFPLIGRVSAAGMSLRAFEGELKKKLSDGYFKNPQVTVAVEQYRSQQVFVMGEVRQPGPVALTGGMTLIEALARAGSTLPSASGEVSIVRAPQGAQGPVLPGQQKDAEMFRASIRDLESGSLKQNIELADGDTIFVPRAEEIYVFGEVKNPGSYALKSVNTTVLQALSLAGGVTPNGAMGRIKVARIVNGEKVELKVKLTDLVKPGDTLIVPERYF
ncbi:MAG TPA: polysaccharide biosynthesis/export family protein [Vicinamibacterales bacterium]